MATHLNDLNHPAVQSLALPFVLATLGLAFCLVLQRQLANGHQAGSGRRPGWVAGGALLGLLPMTLLTGLDWPAVSRTQQLPWVVLAGLAVALWAAVRAQPGPAGNFPAAWRATSGLWLLACVWLNGGQAAWWGVGLAALAGALVLALLSAARCRVVAAAVLCVVALALALLAANGGSLLLAQLAMMLACSTAVPGLCAWLLPATGLRVPGWLLQPLGLAGLAIGWTWVLSNPKLASGHAVQLAVLVLAFGVPLLLPSLLKRLALRPGLPAQRNHWAVKAAPVVAVLLAALPAAVAIGLQWAGPSDGLHLPGQLAADPDDPYYTPPTGDAAQTPR